VKYRDSADQWFKVKANDTLDVKVVRCIEGAGKFAGSLGAMVSAEDLSRMAEIS
jgi:ATP-dependent DNA ligase